jgi:2-C-methyl-D-erythritol 2,4-cyclodiphosphate synthase
MADLRVGFGYDLHAFADGRALVLGGVHIEHTRGLAGHSDADVLSHALIDALLGAAGWGDLGDWFPPDDPRFRDAVSSTLLVRVAEELRDAGWHLLNVDTTVVAQEPRLVDLRVRIRNCLAGRLGMEISRVSLKATTTDHVGAIGRGEGIAAYAVVLLEAPVHAPQGEPSQEASAL